MSMDGTALVKLQLVAEFLGGHRPAQQPAAGVIPALPKPTQTGTWLLGLSTTVGWETAAQHPKRL